MLIIIGQLSFEQEKLLRIHKINFKNYVNIQFAEVISLYKKADIVTFVSTYEGFGLPIIEANATGRVVITSNISSMPEVAGDAALFVDPYNPEDIKAGIQKVIQNKKLRNQLIQNGLQNAKRFSPQTIANHYVKLYRSL